MQTIIRRVSGEVPIVVKAGRSALACLILLHAGRFDCGKA
jgi:hypothetical protein